MLELPRIPFPFQEWQLGQEGLRFPQRVRRAPSNNEKELGDQWMDELEGTLAISQSPIMRTKKETEPHRGQVLPKVTHDKCSSWRWSPDLPPQCSPPS